MAAPLLLLLLLLQRAEAAGDRGASSQKSAAKSFLQQRGSSRLLPQTPRTAPPLPPLPWGSGIRFDDGGGYFCTEDHILFVHELFMKRVAEHVGPVFCIRIPSDSSGAEEMLKGAVNVRFSPSWILNPRIRYLYPHTQNDLCLVVKRNEPRRQSILQSLTGSTWAATGACVALVVAAQRLAGRRGVLLETLRTFLSGAFFEESRRPVLNFLSLLLSAFGVLMITAFCAKFMSFLAVSGEVAQPKTLEEVNARVSRVYFDVSYSGGLKNYEEDDAVDHLVAKEQEWSTSREQTRRDVASSPRAALVAPMNKLSLLLHFAEWVDAASGRRLVHLVPQCMRAPAYMAFQVSPVWLHAERFSAVVQRAVEAGHFIKAERDIYMFYRTVAVWVPDMVPSDDPVALGVAAMLEPVVVLGAGAALASIAFVVECAAHRWRLRRPQGQRARAYSVQRPLEELESRLRNAGLQ